VLTLDPQVGDFAQADVLIEDGKIRAVAPSIAASNESTALVDAANRIVLPGFIDTHHHFYQGIRATSSPMACSTPTTIATSAIR
jgi:5-methylthioadenosine/S-adenosylhomocysteine deaminase